MNPLQERTIAIAGVLQACAQVQALARTGDWHDAAATTSIKSILILDALNTPAVFGGLEGVRTGLELLQKGIFESAAVEDVELAHYATALLHLQQQLYRDRVRFEKFAEAIEPLSRFQGDELYSECSDVYQQFISEMRPQIIVQGEQSYLQREDVPARIRTLLLAGVRAAVLWQQKGGTRWNILWERTRFKNQARELSQHSPSRLN